jgi:histidinol-phosphate aminotransferase
MYDAARLPYNVGALTQLVAERVVADHAGLAERVSCVTRERERVAHALSALSHIESYPSVANFLLFRHRAMPASRLHAALLDRGVLVRDVSSWPDAGESLRVTIGTPAENDRFIAALASAGGD